MIKERTKSSPSYGYIRIRSNTITMSRSILERAVLFEGSNQTKISLGISTKEKVEKKSSVKK